MCCLVSHAFFLYGQTAVDWRLDLNATADVSINLDGFVHDKIWQNLLNFVHLKPDQVFKTYNLTASAGYTIKSFTYMGAITDLWNMFTPGTYVASVLLFLFSALWPHLKLFFLHLLWYISAERKLRTRVLYWLDTFGKWSLADVFVVCTMLTVLRLQIDVTGDHAFNHVVDQLDDPTVWDKLRDSINVDAGVLCNGIHSLVGNSFNATACEADVTKYEGIITLVIGAQNGTELHDWNEPLLRNCSASGPASVSMKVVGENGIYAFCAGAFLSLLTSAYVGHLDRKFRCETSDHRQSVAGGSNPFELTTITRRIIPEFPRSRSFFIGVFAVVTFGIVLCASFVDSLERRVIGSVPIVAESVLDANLTTFYSIYDIAHQSAASGGGDYFMMLTFVIFALFGPIIRALSVFVTLFFPLPRAVQKKAVRFIDALGSFCGVEVLLIATLLVIMEIVPITGTIFGATNHLDWVCTILHATAFDLPDFCLEVHLLITNAYYIVIASWVCHVVCALFMMSTGYRAVDPVGDGSDGLPHCCVQCPQLSLECLTCWSGYAANNEASSTACVPINYDYSKSSRKGAPKPQRSLPYSHFQLFSPQVLYSLSSSMVYSSLIANK